MAWPMLPHVQFQQPDEFDLMMWPFALNCNIKIHNNMPTNVKKGLCPNKAFPGVILGCGPLNQSFILGCPCHTRTPGIQDGNKIPKWEPFTCAGQLLGFSEDNLRTDQITPQFHVVFDEMFCTVVTEMKMITKRIWIDNFQCSKTIVSKITTPKLTL